MIDRILALSTEEFAAHMRGLLSQDDAIWQFDDLDDALIKVVEERPEEVDRICTLNASLIAEMPDGEAKRYCRAYNYNIAMIAAFFRHNDPPRVASIFLEGLAYCKEHVLYEAGKSLVGNMIHMRKSASLVADEMFPLLRVIKDFYVALGRHEDAIETLCTAALKFAEARAFQSAYRALNDAQDISIGSELIREQVRVLETQGTVALIEGDLKCAGDEFKKCFEILDHLGEPASFELRSNAALVELQSERPESAGTEFQSLLDDFPGTEYDAQRRQVLINLLACRRKIGDEAGSMALVEQIDSTLDEAGTEQRVEAQLIVAKTLVRFEKVSLAMTRLHDACFQIQREIDSFQRLHYRRGVRERYLDRIRAFLGDLPDSGRADDILPLLALCSSNGLLDWFSVLQWCDEVDRNAAVPAPLRAELHECVEELVRFGTPFMYGFREKYDDPFDFPEDIMSDKVGAEMAKTIDYSGPWHRFNTTTDRIRQLASAILLNRRSAVVASRWNVMEMAAYVFSYLMYERLKGEKDSAVAFITAMADLHDLTKTQALEIFNAIEDEDARRKRVKALTDSPIEFPFRDPYYLGMFQFHSLLVE